VGGDDATFGALEEARGELRDRIIGDVLHPVDAWRELLRVVEASAADWDSGFAPSWTRDLGPPGRM
ncbi:hypothetical protein MNEG_4053, partial [Monoraphidium neglectum]